MTQDPMDELDAKIQTIITRAATDIMAEVPVYMPINPMRVMRLVSTTTRALQRILADAGAVGGDDEDEGEGGQLYKGGKITFPKKDWKTRELEGIIAALSGPLEEYARPSKISSLASALQSAVAAGDLELAAELRQDIEAARAAMSAVVPVALPQPLEDEEPSDAGLPEPINDITYEDA